MPTYQYVCTECGDDLEAVQSFSDEPLSVCPACGGRLRKVFSSVGVVFKGSGFYRNDSRAKTGTDAPKSSEAGSAKEGAKDGAKDGAKPAKESSSSGSAASGGSGGSGGAGGTGSSAPKSSSGSSAA